MERFERIDKLGEGGQGKVYKVRRKETQEVQVLKMINCTDPTFAALAEREIEVMKACKHHHIIRLEESFHYTGKSGDWVCIVMQYCPGGDLFSKFKQAVTDRKKFKESQLVTWICQISAGLQYMHERDLWHRDIKAANILFDADGVLKLGDFGLSSSYSPNGHKTVVGTPFYFAPEIMLNQKYTNKVDIWNLGVLMLELMTFKQLPINVEVLRNNHMQQKIMKSIMKEGYSRKVALLVASMLGKMPDDRPSAREILQQLQSEQEYQQTKDSELANLRATLETHPLFLKAAEGKHTHHQKNVDDDTNTNSNKRVSKTPPNNTVHTKDATESRRKRATLQESEIQRGLAHERNTVNDLAERFDQPREQQSPKKKAVGAFKGPSLIPDTTATPTGVHTTHTTGTTHTTTYGLHSPVTPQGDRGIGFAGSNSNSERNSGHIHTGNTPTTTTTPRYPRQGGASPTSPQSPGVGYNARKQHVQTFPKHARSGEGSGSGVYNVSSLEHNTGYQYPTQTTYVQSPQNMHFDRGSGNRMPNGQPYRPAPLHHYHH